MLIARVPMLSSVEAAASGSWPPAGGAIVRNWKPQPDGTLVKALRTRVAVAADAR